MPAIKFYDHEPIPVEMHKVKIVQQLQLLSFSCCRPNRGWRR